MTINHICQRPSLERKILCRWVATEGEVYDINYGVRVRDMQIQELEMEVSDMRGKFIIPKLKKVHNFKLMGGEE